VSSNDTRTQEPGGAGRLGEHRVARIGFGAMQLTESRDRTVSRETAVAILRTAVERGVNHIDTAEFYGTATENANDLIRAALHPYSENLAIATKVGAVRDASGALVPAQRPEELRAAVEANLTRLGTERLALVNLRRVDGRPGIVAEGDQIVDIDSQLAELAALRDEGKIAGIGMSSVTADQLRRALPVGIVCVQNLYSLVDRTGESVLDVCREHDVAWVPFFPLGSAFPGYPKVVDQPAVQAAAAALGATPAQIGLAWLLAHYEETLLIPGTANPDHLAENIAAGDIRLDPDTLKELDQVSAA
jgi:pyridoxine 4-dehydrogenase